MKSYYFGPRERSTSSRFSCVGKGQIWTFFPIDFGPFYIFVIWSSNQCLNKENILDLFFLQQTHEEVNFKYNLLRMIYFHKKYHRTYFSITAHERGCHRTLCNPLGTPMGASYGKVQKMNLILSRFWTLTIFQLMQVQLLCCRSKILYV